jgi:hypothetical protein
LERQGYINIQGEVLAPPGEENAPEAGAPEEPEEAAAGAKKPAKKSPDDLVN